MDNFSHITGNKLRKVSSEENFKAKNMRMKIIALSIFILLVAGISSCKKYLDIVPDNVATLENAFAMRGEAEKYLFTCYSYMPRDGEINGTPALFGGDEVWELPDISETSAYRRLAEGNQNVIDPIGNVYWTEMYRAIRDCNIFLENIGPVPDMEMQEKRQWIAEVKTLKAYYHFLLVRMYGPIPLIRVNLPVSAGVKEVKVFREPVDSCFGYIAQLLDEAKEDLPETIIDPQYYGKITKPIAYSLKAKALTFAASPLFNGNAEQANLKNSDGTPLFSSEYSEAKWQRAADACREAIAVCEKAGIKLYEHPNVKAAFVISDTTQTELSLRMAFSEKWNSELIWANTQSWVGRIQVIGAPDWAPSTQARVWMDNRYNAPLKVAEQFYTNNGLPINEDKTWNYGERYTTRLAPAGHRLYIRNGFPTASLNMNREPRFYANLGFDGGIWYGQGKFNDKLESDLYWLQFKLGDPIGKSSAFNGPVTGYPIKKWIHPDNVRSPSSYTTIPYPWPIMRLADLYLLYSECLNEAKGPDPEVFLYLDKVRERAGIPAVQQAWAEFSTNPAKITNKNGVREIIQRERLNELAFEQQRFWDIRRWKLAITEMNKAITGWNIYGSTTETYYRPTNIFQQRFGVKDYFWPIAESNLNVNSNLVQNLGW